MQMRLWKRASGLLKDQNSIWFSTLSRRSSFRNPDIEAAVIKATSHDEFSFRYDYLERVYKWLRLSDSNIKPVVCCIASRVKKTRSWVVALKGLILIHGVFSTKLSVIFRIGRLPFDLSDFKDGHSKLGKTWAHNTFIRAYYAYLDQKSLILFENLQERGRGLRRDQTIMQDLMLLQKVQNLLDLLLQIKPLAQAASVFLIVEAMECVVFEVFDIYSRFCNMVANVLKKIDTTSKAEAALILLILQKATTQGEELALYLEFCREIGVRNAMHYTEIPEVPEEDIQFLEHIVHGPPQDKSSPQVQAPQSQELVLREAQTGQKLKTTITSDWEKFDEDFMTNRVEMDSAVSSNPFLSLTYYDPQPQMHQRHQELPDLITF